MNSLHRNAARLVLPRKGDVNRAHRFKKIACDLAPFHCAHAVPAAEDLLKAQVIDLVRPAEPVEIEVIHRQPPLVLVHQRKGGAGNLVFIPTQAAHQSADKGSLSRAQTAVEQQYVSVLQIRAERRRRLFRSAR